MIMGPHFSESTAHIIHFCFEWLAVLSGVLWYKSIQNRRIRAQAHNAAVQQRREETPFAILIGCIGGAAIGNKAVFLLEVPQVIEAYGWLAVMTGQTIVGGLLGGLLGVELAKKIIVYQSSTGDDFVWPLTAGMIIGRIGCFLAGLHDGTYGIETSLPWGVNFGDGIARHPTQIYDQLFVLTLAVSLYLLRRCLSRVPGLTFKCFLAGYLLWRLWIDTYKPIPCEYWGLSAIQLICIIALIFYLPFCYRDLHKL